MWSTPRGTPPTFEFSPKPALGRGERDGILDLQAATELPERVFCGLVYKGWGARWKRALANFFFDVINTREDGLHRKILHPS